MIIYVVTARGLRPDLSGPELAERIARSGADWMQVRDKGSPARERLGMAGAAVAAGGARVYVNGRPDLALAAGAEGVHLPADGLPVAAVRERWSARLRIGASTHSPEEAAAAAQAGADFVLFGPVFETESKRAWGPPAGLERLSRAVAASAAPVLAVGGVTPARMREIAATGAAGVAVISWVVSAIDMGAAVSALREGAAA